MLRSASFKEDEGTWRGNDDGKVVNNQPQRVMDERSGIGAQGGYIAKYDYKFTYFIITVKRKPIKSSTTNLHTVKSGFLILIVN